MWTWLGSEAVARTTASRTLSVQGGKAAGRPVNGRDPRDAGSQGSATVASLRPTGHFSLGQVSARWLGLTPGRVGGDPGDSATSSFGDKTLCFWI